MYPLQILIHNNQLEHNRLQKQHPTGERFNPDTVDVSLIDDTHRYLMSWSFAAHPEIELQQRHMVIFLLHKSTLLAKPRF